MFPQFIRRTLSAKGFINIFVWSGLIIINSLYGVILLIPKIECELVAVRERRETCRLPWNNRKINFDIISLNVIRHGNGSMTIENTVRASIFAQISKHSLGLEIFKKTENTKTN